MAAGEPGWVRLVRRSEPMKGRVADAAENGRASRIARRDQGLAVQARTRFVVGPVLHPAWKPVDLTARSRTTREPARTFAAVTSWVLIAAAIVAAA
jgi:hypothetical protein